VAQASLTPLPEHIAVSQRLDFTMQGFSTKAKLPTAIAVQFAALGYKERVLSQRDPKSFFG
jgi:hypothetical protein